MTLPLLALTVGDPAGIGPEIVVRSMADAEVRAAGRCLAVGDPAAVARALDVSAIDWSVHPVDDPAEARFAEGVIDVLDTGALGEALPEYGQVTKEAGKAAVAAIERATAAAMTRSVDAVVTAPVNKEAIWAAGSEHLGHTEMLAALTGARRSTTMFLVRDLKIFFATRHASLRKALDQLDVDTVRQAIEDSLEALRVFGHPEPRLGVAAVNPHGGENGNFGDEEIRIIGPAVQAAREGGADVLGPVPADSVFHQGLQGRFDGVLSQFHDQGHIAAKTVDFDGTVSVTAGLPILRTSVDHGTAFDIAGTGRASYRTMAAAALAGARLSRHLDAIRATWGR
jgi:4-phospho-D-threonate 3-dehydrogenase / 4-phospho-D-erythronate 3-dehydrogenase